MDVITNLCHNVNLSQNDLSCKQILMQDQGPVSIQQMWLYQYSHYKDNIFIKEIHIPGKTVFILRRGPVLRKSSPCHDVILPKPQLYQYITATIKWPLRRVALPVNRGLVQHFVQTNNNETSKVLLLSFCEGNPPVNSPHKETFTQKCYNFTGVAEG